MKIKWNLLPIAFATTLLLTACGTNPDSGENTTNGSTDVVEETDKVVEKEGTEEGTEVVVEEESEVVTEDVVEEETEVTDETTSTDSKEDFMKDSIMTESDEQSYTISVLPKYTLTSEEPGKDSLMATEDESVFMRIETMPKEEGTYDYSLENMNAVLEASSDGDTPVEVTDEASIPVGDGIENVKVLSVKAETASITGIIFERGDMIVKLTIYDSPNKDHFENFLHMSETIVAK